MIGKLSAQARAMRQMELRYHDEEAQRALARTMQIIAEPTVAKAHAPLPRRQRPSVAHPVQQQVYLPPRGLTAFGLLGGNVIGRR